MTVGFADGLAEHAHRDTRHRHREQVEPQHTRVVQRRDDNCHGHACDERHDGAEAGLHHLLNIFDVTHDFGQQASCLGLRVVLDGQALQFVHHCTAQLHFHPAGQARAGAGVQPRRQDVLHDEHTANDEIQPELRQIMVLGVGDDVDDIGNDDWRDPRRGMLDSEPERRPKQLVPVSAVQPQKLAGTAAQVAGAAVFCRVVVHFILRLLLHRLQGSVQGHALPCRKFNDGIRTRAVQAHFPRGRGVQGRGLQSTVLPHKVKACPARQA